MLPKTGIKMVKVNKSSRTRREAGKIERIEAPLVS